MASFEHSGELRELHTSGSAARAVERGDLNSDTLVVVYNREGEAVLRPAGEFEQFAALFPRPATKETKETPPDLPADVSDTAPAAPTPPDTAVPVTYADLAGLQLKIKQMAQAAESSAQPSLNSAPANNEKVATPAPLAAPKTRAPQPTQRPSPARKPFKWGRIVIGAVLLLTMSRCVSYMLKQSDPRSATASTTGYSFTRFDTPRTYMLAPGYRSANIRDRPDLNSAAPETLDIGQDIVGVGQATDSQGLPWIVVEKRGMASGYGCIKARLLVQKD